MLLVKRTGTGEGKYTLEAVIIQSEDGFSVYLGGGEKPHVGSIVLCQPRPSLKEDGSLSSTTSVLNIVGHKDECLARPLAEKLCQTMNQTVVVTAGVHIENAASEDIMLFLKLAEELTGEILDILSGV